MDAQCAPSAAAIIIHKTNRPRTETLARADTSDSSHRWD